jgi:phage I-like protein
MSRPAILLALCSAQPIAVADGQVPEWVHLLPAGEIRTADGRGPYTVKSMQAVADASMAAKGLIDECHSTDRAAPLGQSAPARGWFTEMEVRDDGLWGKVDWNDAGKALMADKAYRGISPVIQHTKDNQVLAVLRASLINTPNLVGLASLHSEETGMDYKAQLLGLLGLASDADDAAVTAAVDQASTSLHGQDASNEVITSLQSELADMGTKYNSLLTTITTDKATAFVDGAIAAKRVGVKPQRDRYIAMHARDPEGTEAIINSLPIVGNLAFEGDPPAADESGLSDTDRTVMSMFGIDEAKFKEGQAASGKKVEAL